MRAILTGIVRIAEQRRRKAAQRRLEADRAMRERFIGKPYAQRREAAKRGWQKRRAVEG